MGKIHQEDRSLSEWVELGQHLKQKMDFGKALNAFAAARIQLIVEMGDCFANLARLSEASVIYDEIIAYHPVNVKALLGRGVVALMQNDFNNAELLFSRAGSVEPNNSKVLCGLGMARFGQGRQSEAFELFKQTLEVDPENITALHELTKASYVLERYDEASHYTQRYLMYHPHETDFLFSLAGLYYKQGSFREAMDTLERLLIISPGYEGAAELMVKAQGESASSRSNRQAEPFATGTGRHLTTSSEFNNNGRLLKGQGRFADALKSFTTARESGDFSVVVDMADCLANLGKHSEALSLYQEALDRDGNDARALVGHGVINLLQENYNISDIYFNRALKNDPTNNRALTGLGMVRNLQGKPRDAFTFFSKALDSDPENLNTLSNLLAIAYESNLLREAEPYLKKYLMYHPVNNHILFSLAGLLYRIGNYSEALENLERLLVFEPSYEGGQALKELLIAALTSEPIRSNQEISSKNDHYLVSIIIPLYNKVNYTRQCLDALALNTDQSLGYEIILVNNGSNDETADYLRTLPDNIKVISNPKNLGFAMANNQAAKLAKGSYLVFLNNDTIPHPGWLEALIAGIEQYGADIVGAKLIYPDNRIQHAGVAFDEESIGYHIFRNLPADLPAANRKRFMQCVTAACMMIKRQVFEELNGFDEAYVNGFEDVDLCLRAVELGRKILYTPECLLTHFAETSEGRHDHEDKNMLRYLDRWKGKVRCDDSEFYRIEGYRKEEIGNGRVRLHQEPPSRAHTQPADDMAPVISKACNLSSRIGNAMALKSENKYDEALDIFTRCLESGDHSVLVDMADCLANLGKHNDASTLYLKALDRNREDERALIGLGVVNLLHEKSNNSVMYFNKALKIDPTNSRALAGMGMVRNLQGKTKDAFSFFSMALDSDPENLNVLNDLLKIAYASDLLPEAEPHLRKYLMYHPVNNHILFSLAGLLYRVGEYSEALDTIDGLLIFEPSYEGGQELRGLLITALGADDTACN